MNFIRTLTLRQLQIFVVAARHLSYARAAEELHLTPPAVSMQLKQLEDNVGLPLFERLGRGVALTAAGELLVHHALRVLGEIKDAEANLLAMLGAETGQLSVGLVSTAKYFMPRLLARFAQLHPGIEVQFSVGNRESLLQKLQDNAIDLAVMGRIPTEIDAHAEPMASHPYVLIGPADHPLRAARRFDLHELRQETFLLREEGSGSRRVAEEMFKNHLFTPPRTISMGSNETIKQAVMAGMGIALISLHTLPLELKTGEVSVLDAIGTPIERTWYVVHMNAKRLLPAGQRFREFLLDNAAAALAQEFDVYLQATGG
ncbi:MAG: LysR family transcriptional regulator [Gammaproteobacteria bacterium]|nr:LysR family transcriptional regulator [Gammaproteobacteria bacterium]MBU1601443.1 LysR family transcriptional regulator [Gammaproteobacteria bacterium]MBU2433638.1 LysR family transcriptional regulator [Gammaproteobacteria bacterium]MBU2449824.1 LysR family transcriptional regulator [Gammaproteobacteria bacterium]